MEKEMAKRLGECKILFKKSYSKFTGRGVQLDAWAPEGVKKNQNKKNMIFNENQPKLQPVDNPASMIEKISAPPMPKNTQPQIDARTLFPNDPLAGAIQQAQANTGIMSLPRRA